MMSQDYLCRNSLKQNLKGPHYQVLVALHLMLTALKEKKQFRVMLELEGVGALDDVVIEYLDDGDNVLEKHYIQLKHANNDTETLEKGDLCNKSGKCEVFKYFDDWFFFVRERANATRSQCFYFSNRDFNDATKTYLTKNGVELRGDGYHFTSASFATDSNYLYQNLRRLVTSNSVVCNKDLYEQASAAKKRNPTYTAAKAYYDAGNVSLSGNNLDKILQVFLEKHYRLAVGQPCADAFEITVIGQIRDFYSQVADTKGISDALILEAWQWFRVLGRTEVWTAKSVREKLDDFCNRFIAVPIAFGAGYDKLQSMLVRVPNRCVPRDTLLKKLIDFINDWTYTVKLLYGIPKVGKSTLVAQYLLKSSSLKLGEYLYFESPKTFLVQYAEFVHAPAVKVFVIDGVDAFLDELRNAIVVLSNSGKKCLLISSCNIDVSEKFEIPSLSRDEILRYLDILELQKHCLMVGDKALPLHALAASEEGGLFSQMQYPAQLLQLCELARIPTEVDVRKAPYHSRYVARWPEGFEPIPLCGVQVVPLYSLDEILKHREFDGGRVIYYKSQEELDFVKGQYSSIESCLWVDAVDLSFEDDKAIKDSFADYLGRNRQERKFRHSRLTLLLNNPGDGMAHRKEELLRLSNVVLFTMVDVVDRRFLVREHEGKCVFECYISTPQRLPSSECSFIKPLENAVDIVFEKEQFQAGTSLVVASAGSGKTTLLQKICNQHAASDSLTWGIKYHHVVFVPLHLLPNLGFNNLVDVAISFLDLKITDGVLKAALQEDISKNRILFLLDGWDELSGEDRKIIQALLEQLRQYGDFVVTARPTDRGDLFCAPILEYELLPFDEKQIKACFESYFKSDDKSELVNNFVAAAVRFVLRPENRSALDIIGLPLQCYLLCEAWKPYFEAACLGSDIKMPWKDSAVLNRVELYQLFIASRLRRVFAEKFTLSRVDMSMSAEEVYARNDRLVETLQAAAYENLFRGKPLKVGNGWIGKDIKRLAIIFGENFFHKTYAECFAALYLVNLLKRDLRQARKIIEVYRYQPHYRLVFEFMAGIVSYGYSAIPRAEMLLRDFWEALLQEPRDCINRLEKKLIAGCCQQSNMEELRVIFAEDDFATLSKDKVTPPATFLAGAVAGPIVLNDSPRTVAFRSSGGVEAKDADSVVLDETEKFVEPTASDYDCRERKRQINNLPISAYDEDELKKALSWLEATLSSSSSFLVEGACTQQKKECVQQLLLKSHKIDCKLLSDYLKKLNLSDQVSRVFALVNVNSAILAGMSARLDRKTPVHFMDVCFLAVLASKKRTWVDKYFNYLLSLSYSKRSNTFEQIHALLKPTRELLDHGMSKYRQRWITQVYSFAMQATIEHNYKNLLADLIRELVVSAIDKPRMECLLKKFLSKKADYGYWDCDAVMPCFDDLIPYFGNAYKAYLQYKTINTQEFERLVTVDAMASLSSKADKIWMIDLCLTLDDKERVDRKAAIRYSSYLPYLNAVEFALVVQTILNDLNLSRVQLFREFLQSNDCALTIYEREINVYRAAGHQRFVIEKAKCDLLLIMTREDSIYTVGRPLPEPASPNVFVLGMSVDELPPTKGREREQEPVKAPIIHENTLPADSYAKVRKKLEKGARIATQVEVDSGAVAERDSSKMVEEKKSSDTIQVAIQGNYREAVQKTAGGSSATGPMPR